MAIFKNQSLTPRTQNPISAWQNEMNNLFRRFSQDFGNFDVGAVNEFYPKVEIKEKDKNYLVCAEVPGMKESDIEITLEDNNLILQGERKSEKKDQREGFLTSEFSYGSFYRTIPLDDEVNPDSVKASYKDGILTIEMDKVRESTHRSKKIPILKS